MKNKEIYVSQARHKELDVITLTFVFDHELMALAKSVGCVWSGSLRVWHLENNGINYTKIQDTFKGFATIRSTYKANFGLVKNPEVLQHDRSALSELNEEKLKKIIQFQEYLRSKRYAGSTIKTYCEALRTFLRFFHDKPFEEINPEDFIQFNNRFILKNNYSASYQNQVVNAIKLFFGKIEHTAMDLDLIHRPKRAKLLPNVLSKEEVKAILGAHENIKHKAMLSMIYSCGLRRSELLNLKPTDIDSKRGIVIIRQSKGKKDRITPLSPKILTLLREYFIAYKPSIWLFEGQVKKNKYSERSLEEVLKKSIRLAGINKPVTLHWLRHSYATHLLESGTDLRYIQELLGHNSSRTTEIYTHVSTKSIQQIKSPFDDL